MGSEGDIPEVEHGGPDWGMPPWAQGVPLPAFTHIDGRNVVLADAGEYRALLALQDAVFHLGAPGCPKRLFRLDKDPEVRAFILERIATEDVDKVRLAAIERFGADRVPGKSSVHRFVACRGGGRRPG